MNHTIWNVARYAVEMEMENIYPQPMTKLGKGRMNYNSVPFVLEKPGRFFRGMPPVIQNPVHTGVSVA